jgi:TPR repeat protein
MGIKASKIKAQAWLRRAADQHHLKSIFQLGKLLYYNGQKDHLALIEAEEWFKKGAIRGDARCFWWQGKFHAEGIVVNKSAEFARTYFEKAKQAGYNKEYIWTAEE